MIIPGILKFLVNSLLVLLIVLVIMFIWFIFWKIIKIPIKMKDDILKERDQARTELTEIQVAKAIEWDKYKEVVDERDKVRNALIQEKKTNDQLKEENSKLTVHNDNLRGVNSELKKQQKEPKKA